MKYILYWYTVFLVNIGTKSLPLALQAFKFTDTSCWKSIVSLSFAEHKNPWIPLIPGNRRINVEKILVNDQVDLHSPIFSDEIIQWFLHLSKDNSVIDQ